MAGLDGFTMPGIPELQPARVDYGGLLRATETQGQSAKNLIGTFEGAAKLATGIYGLAEKSMQAQAQNDAEAAGQKFEQTASDLVANHRFGYEDAPMEEGGPAAPPTKNLRLDPSFDQSIRETQSALMDKYKDFPAIQDSLMGMLRTMAGSAYRTAHDKASELMKNEGKTAVIDSAARAAKQGVESGDSSVLDAIFSNKGNQTLFSPEEWDTIKRRSYDTFNRESMYQAGINAMKQGGLEAGQNAIAQEGGKRDLDPAAIITAGERLNGLNRQMTAAYAQQTGEAEADAAKNKTSLEDAAAKLDASAQYPSVMRQFTDRMRVDGQMEPVKYLLQSGQETAATNLRDHIAETNGWSDAQRKYSDTAFNAYKADFTSKDEGTASGILQWWADARSQLMLGSLDGGSQGAVRQVRSMMIEGQAQNAFGTKASEAMNHVLGELQQTITREGKPSTPSDRATLARYEDAIVGKGLTAQEIAGFRPQLDRDFIGKKLSETDYKMFTNVLSRVSDTFLSNAAMDLKRVFTDANGKLDAAGFASTFGSLVNIRQANSTMNAGEFQGLVDAAVNSRKAVIADQAVSTASPQRNFLQSILNITTADERNMTTAMLAVQTGDLAKAISAKNGDAVRAASHLSDLAVESFKKQQGIEAGLPAENVFRKMFTYGGQTYLLAVKDPRRGSSSVWAPSWEGNKLTWKTIPVPWEKFKQ